VKAILGTLGYSILSSVVPIFNIEVYLVALATQVAREDTVLLALMAGLGQAVGKLVWYEATARSLDLPMLKRRLEAPKRQAQLAKWEGRVNGRPWVGFAASFVSGLVGVPPLLVMGVVAGVVRMNRVLFFLAIVLGRGLQSWAILAGMTSLFH
jgi:membrane protein YqaA with SNARE-associated domain